MVELAECDRDRRRSIIFSNSGASSEESAEVIEIVEQDIINSSVEVGSGCEWRGSGVEPQWDNPKSTKVYDHIARHHGPKLKHDNLRGRGATKNKEQSQWLNERDWVKAEQVTPKHHGLYIIDFKRPIGRVYHSDGTITENVTHAFIRRKEDGTLKSAYPVINSSTLASLSRKNNNE